VKTMVNCKEPIDAQFTPAGVNFVNGRINTVELIADVIMV
jgi:hypothetical protein